MEKTSPAFQFYPKDWLSDGKITMMSLEQKGVYIQLLCYMWQEDDCSLAHEDFEYLSGLDSTKLQPLLKCFTEMVQKLHIKDYWKRGKNKKS